MRLGHPQMALQEFLSAITLSPNPRVQEAAWSQMGRALLQMRRYDEAAASYRNALAIQPRDEDALLGSGALALHALDFKLAVKDFSLAAQVNATDVNLLLLAQALRQSGQAVEANRVEAQAQRVSSNFAQTQRAVAEFLALAGIDIRQSS